MNIVIIIDSAPVADNGSERPCQYKRERVIEINAVSRHIDWRRWILYIDVLGNTGLPSAPDPCSYGGNDSLESRYSIYSG